MSLSGIKNFFLGSLRRQLITGVALVHAVLMAVFVYDLVLRQEKTLVEHQAEHAMALAQTLAVSSAGWIAASDIAGLEEILQAQRKYPELAFAMLTSKDGIVLSHTDRQKLGLKVIDLPETANMQILYRGKDLVDVASPAMIAGRHVGWARVGIGAQITHRKVKESARNGILYASIAIVVGSLLAWFMGLKVTSRLYLIQETINAIKAGSHEARTRLGGNDEAAILAGEFDAMLDALSQRDAQLQEHTDELRHANLNLEKIVLERTQQVRASLAQVEKREFELKMAQNVARIGSWMLDIPNDALTWSDETYAIFEIPAGTPLSLETIATSVHPDDHDRVAATWSAAMTGSPYDIEHRIVVDGRTKWVHGKAQIQFDKAGNPISGIGIVQDITDIKQYELDLKEREELYRSMFNSHSIMLLIDPVTAEIADANQAACDFYGYSHDAMLKLRTTDINTADPQIVKSDMQAAKEGRRSYFDTVHRLSNGTLRNVEVYSGKVRVHGETLLHSIIFDVTQRRQAEETTQRLAAIIESSNDAIISSSMDGVITIWNRAAEKLFGYSVHEALGMPLWRLWPEDLKDDEKAILPLVREGLSVSQYESRRVHKNGKLIDVSISISPIRDIDGNIVAASKIIRDITDRKKTEREIAEAEERLRTIFDHSPDAYLIVAADNAGIIECNPAAEAMLGGTREQIIGKSPEKVSPPIQPDGRKSSEAAAEKLKTSLRTGGNRFEWLHQRFDGTQFWVDVSMTIMTLSGRQVLFVSWRDIGERKRMEQELDDTLASLEKSNKELEHFAYIASHDLQEPLRMISSYVQLLSRRYRDKLDADANDFIDYAVDGATRMKGMIDALLSYARVNTRGRELTPVDSDKVLADSLKNLELAIAEKEATVLHDPLPRINADEVQLGQLFQNLIGNAIKFRKPDAPPRVHISARQELNLWHFTVTDNGIGIDQKDKDRIFMIFQRLHTRQKYTGTGIGLALCKKIIERHGGQIWVASEKDNGMTVHFTLPDIGEN